MARRTIDHVEVPSGNYEIMGPDAKLFSAVGFVFSPSQNEDEAIPISSISDFLRSVCAFSRDGKLFASGTGNGVVFVADIEKVRSRLADLDR